MNKTVRNVAASVRDRLLAHARAHREDAQYVLIRYANERFLYRLSRSAHRDRFILKGATLFTLWGDEPHRPTRDMDFLATGQNSITSILPTFRDICQTAVEEDGILFPPESVTAQERRDEETYPGFHIELLGILGSARLPLQIDLGFGDAVTPPAADVELPVLLDFPRPRLRAYPRETVVAEKLEAMTKLSIANSRMKDFYDLWYLSRHFAFEGASLSAAIRATFARRNTGLPGDVPLALTDAFAADTSKQAQWTAFVRRSKLTGDGSALPEVIEALHTFLWPPLEAMGRGSDFGLLWEPGGPWTTAKDK